MCDVVPMVLPHSMSDYKDQFSYHQLTVII